MSKHTRRRLIVLGRVLVSFALLAYLLAHIDPAKLLGSWRDVNLRLLGLCGLLQIGGVAISTAKWWLLLDAAGERLPYLWLGRVYFVGQFFNNFLPTMIGGDAVRVYQVSQRTRTTTALVSVFVERLTGFLALTSIAWIGYSLNAIRFTWMPGVRWVVVVCLVFASASVCAALCAPVLMRGLSWLRLPDVLSWRARLERVAQSLSAYRSAPATLALVMVLAFLYQLVWIGMHAVAAGALGLSVPFAYFALLIPVTDIVSLLPIFFNNLGAREGIFVVLLQPLGVSSASALALALLVYATRLLVSLIGGLLYLGSSISGGVRLFQRGLER